MVRAAEVDQLLHLAKERFHIPGKDQVRVDLAGDQDIEGGGWEGGMRGQGSGARCQVRSARPIVNVSSSGVACRFDCSRAGRTSFMRGIIAKV